MAPSHCLSFLIHRNEFPDDGTSDGGGGSAATALFRKKGNLMLERTFYLP
jgi:hypothetical protein